MKDGFVKVCCATPDIRVADTKYNRRAIVRQIREAAEAGASIVVFPELCVTGYTCGDLFLQQTLLEGARNALLSMVKQTETLDILAVVGLPWSVNNALYNCAAVFCRGKILGMVPKINIPNYGEFYEARHFSSGEQLGAAVTLDLGTEKNSHVFFGKDLLFPCETVPDLIVGVEICEDLWAPTPPSVSLALSGATVLCNLSASNEIVGKAKYRRRLTSIQSARLMCAYLYADAGMGESTSDLVFSGHNLICENGAVLAESPRYATGLIFSEIDLQHLTAERRRRNTFTPLSQQNVFLSPFSLPLSETRLSRSIPTTPFVPENPETLKERCEEILTIQAAGLATRLRRLDCKNAVVALSGGLDSALALVVTVRAFDLLGLDRAGILTVSMPCFGTTSRTRSNAEKMARAYGASFREIPIGDAVNQHFKDIGHDPAQQDVTFENSQARERTQVVMDLANQLNGLVVGTGDLSELALGWATYNGDHMSMYGVNASVPKTLVRHLTAYTAAHAPDGLRQTLLDILDTPVSPELLPPKDGEIAQKTEEVVGPYLLHDFFLYYFLRFGFPPKKLLRLAVYAFQGVYEEAFIKGWLKVFLRRFFSQQYKRSCLPDGPKVGTVAVSPRGDWRMPSDAWAALWQEELDD